jgi:uncharacterized 2Fe-2S/4Fe-4S cluster protein (DUF4445 family)
MRASEIGICLAQEGIVEFMPLIGSFIGADTTAAVIAADMERAKDIRLLIDLGTNGELVIGNRDKLLATSAAAGPAMEGAGIARGMRAADGAIEQVSITREGVELQVIGDAKAVGICGSGLVDLIAEMVNVGLIEENGRLRSAEEFLGIGGSPALASRLFADGEERAFAVATGDQTEDGQTLALYQRDIRALQLSKGAIAAAAQMLIEEYGIETDQIREILMAGAFGNYIDVGSARRIGLIPDFDGVPVRSIGNAAGMGAQLYLLSESKQKDAKKAARNTPHVDLAGRTDFTMTFAMHMALKPMTDLEGEL